MAKKFKLDDQGHCSSCGNVSIQSEHVKCFSCNCLFHAVCNSATADEKFATKTMIHNFLLPSTKNNFLFFCDICVTKLEISATDSDSQRINLLETKMNTIDSQLKEITSLLVNSNSKKDAPASHKKVETKQPTGFWSDVVKLDKASAPPSKALLVIPKNPDVQAHNENRDIIEKTIVDNQIPLKETFTDKSGALVLVCESTKKRDELKNLVQTAKVDIPMNSPKVKRNPITIVGLGREYTSDETNKLILQNELIRKFAVANNMGDHFKIHSIKPLKNNPEKFQVFATVTQILREGITKLNDKLIMGVNSCKVYDRKNTKRCNNCQMFGHFMANCPTPRDPSCGKCAGKHATNTCESEERNCINCRRNKLDHSTHSAFYHKCPALLKFEELLEHSQRVDDLNSKHPVTNVGR